ncbi:RRP15-like protein [Selaginella moellendorffii]|uniref:RRP15-like protein n=1 Tax=Selaginella moellendorffii TaxID=88036 RepID=UPI000D1C75A1|nr:RRP15-like protein [Selaginella moellendorffii]XP_024545610.1 RRP15-like protein [Selaginella moellendorffii]|eukprot:XP_024539462.1 RRP15-like protein [Selaginella moellendorffii]
MKTAREEDDDAGQDENAYSRAFSKIIKSSYSDSPGSAVGPVLAARRTLVAKKLAAQEDGAVAAKKKKPSKQEQERHLLPESFVNAKEMALIKLATRGVVTLFNAVTKAQKLQADSESLKSRDAKTVIKQSKAAFLSEINNARSQPEDTESRWPVLQNDFVLGKSKLKNWDKDKPGTSDDDNDDDDNGTDDEM